MGRRLNGEMKLNRGTAGNTTNLFVLRFPGLLYTFRPMLRVYVCVRVCAFNNRNCRNKPNTATRKINPLCIRLGWYFRNGNKYFFISFIRSDFRNGWNRKCIYIFFFRDGGEFSINFSFEKRISSNFFPPDNFSLLIKIILDPLKKKKVFAQIKIITQVVNRNLVSFCSKFDLI